MPMKYQTMIMYGCIVTCAVVGVAVMFGWLTGSVFLRSVYPVWPSMKFSTALGFVLTAYIFWVQTPYMRAYLQNRVDLHVLTSSTILFLLMSLMSMSHLSPTIALIAGGMFPSSAAYDPGTTIGNVPSLPSSLLFILIASVGLLAPLGFWWHKFYMYVFGFLLTSVPLLAIIGYIFEQPNLYFGGIISNGMAIHTALLFFIIGLSCATSCQVLHEPRRP